MKKYNFLLLGAVFGALSGYLYWSYFGCTSGCAITSSPLNSSLYGAVMGGFIVQSFVKKEAKS
jgi:hypothetical protein